jgi:hypothetical protein
LPENGYLQNETAGHGRHHLNIGISLRSKPRMLLECSEHHFCIQRLGGNLQPELGLVYALSNFVDWMYSFGPWTPEALTGIEDNSELASFYAPKEPARTASGMVIPTHLYVRLSTADPTAAETRTMGSCPYVNIYNIYIFILPERYA